MKYLLIQSTDEEILKHAECGGAVTSLFKYLLDKKLIDGVLTLKKGEDVYDGIPSLVRSSEELIETCGSLHCAPTNFGSIISKYLNNLKLAVAVKPCDAMAIKELQKRNQINRDSIYTIGLNCGGTISPISARKMIELFYGVKPEDVVKEEIDKGKFIIFLKDGTKKAIGIEELEEKGHGRRKNCQRCELKIPRNADVACGNWGAEKGWTFVEICTDKGEELIKNAEKEGHIKTKAPSDKAIKIRSKIESVMIKLAKTYQKIHLDDEYPSIEKWNEYWNRCIKCYNCKDVCPVCFCNECELNQVCNEDKGEIPPNPIIFHGIRLTFMSFSCINCGQCEDVCPMEIPLAYMYHKMQLKYRDTSGYVSGVDEELPLIYLPKQI